MSCAYLAESLASGVNKLVVLKVLKPELCADPSARAAFHREAVLSAHLSHANTVYVFEVGEYEGAPAIIMEYLDGVPLTRVLSHPTCRLGLDLHLHILLQLLAGLHHFHELKDLEGNALEAVHRDVSPHNVVVLHEGGVKVVDFGIARATATNDQHTRVGMIKGKVHYMPPEQLLGDAAVDRRADIFAVGVMLWEALANRRMWKGVETSNVVRALANGRLPNITDVAPGAPKELVRIAEKALSPDRESRYSTAEEMMLELEQAAAATVGTGLPRDLLEHMSRAFGAERHQRAEQIAQAMKKSAPLSISPDSRSAVTITASGAQTTSTRGSSMVPWRSSRRGLWVGLGIAALLLGSAWIMVKTTLPTAAEPATLVAPPQAVTLEVVTEPEGAMVHMDERFLGKTPLRHTLSSLERASTIEVRKDGYEPVRQEVELSNDTFLRIPLREVAPAEEQTEEAASEEEQTEEASKEEQPPADVVKASARRAPPVRRAVRRWRPPPKSAPVVKAPATEPAPQAPVSQVKSASAAAGAECDPPYRLTSDGVKVYKPECF